MIAGKTYTYDFVRSAIDSQYQSAGLPAQTYTYSTGSLLETDESDYGFCAGSLIRKTLTRKPMTEYLLRGAEMVLKAEKY
jgi:hypothetical protein